jgi:hypothetical protein
MARIIRVESMNETFPATPISVETFAQRVIALDTLRHAICDLWAFAQRMETHPTGWDAADVLRLEEIRQIVEAERLTLPVSRETADEYKEFLRTGRVYPAPFRDGLIVLEKISGPPIYVQSFVAGTEPMDKLREGLEEIVAVASGERQVANDDTEGMEWIDRRARQALAEIFPPATVDQVSPREKSNDEHSADPALVARSNSTSPSTPFTGAFTDGIRSPGKTTHKAVLTRRSAVAPRKADAKIRKRGKKGRRRRRPRGAAGRKNPRD